ncbi:DUF2612 domain-containing protein [Candidatus Gracilibacteria bacterium]|nr:DUF2612 domain-containing protein [Candidatus Gracilibacteria bacterium]
MYNEIKDKFIEYYKNLLILQYYDKPKAREMIGLFAESLVADALIWKLERAFDIETAIGKQLTIIGKYVGVDRIQYGRFIEKEYFSMWFDASDTGLEEVRGFDYDILQQFDGYFLSDKSFNNDIYKLTDDEMRFLIKLQIIKNTLDGTFKSLKENLYKIFGDELFIVDNFNMSITYWTEKNIQNLFLLAISQNFLPMPITQTINIFSVSDINNLFGFGRYSQTDEEIELISGFNYDEDPLTSGGEFFSYSDAIN